LSIPHPQSIPEATNGAVYEEKMIWDEEQRLIAVQNSGGIHHYLYDSKDEWSIKFS